MYERFTDRARRFIVCSQEQARGLNHNYIGTEHFLLGFLAEDSTPEPYGAAQALLAMGVTLESATAAVVEVVDRGQNSPPGHIPFTPRAKKTLELALRESLALGHTYIGTEHILLGLIEQGEGKGIEALKHLDVSPDKLRQKVIVLLAGTPEARAEAGPPVLLTDEAEAGEETQVNPDAVLRWYEALDFDGKTLASEEYFAWLKSTRGMA